MTGSGPRAGWRAMVLVAVGLALAGGISGCGTEQEADATGLDQARDRVHAWYGDAEDAQVDAVLQAWRNNRDVDRCAAEGGYPEWEWRDVISGASWNNPLSMYGALAEEGESMHAAELHFLSQPLGAQVTEATPADTTMSREVERLITDCVNGRPPPAGRGEPEEMIPEDDRRKDAEALQRAWRDVVWDLAQGLGVEESWESDCLAQEVEGSGSDGGGVEGLSVELTDEIHRIRSVVAVEERRVLVEEFRAREQVLVAAVRECVAAQRPALVEELLAALADFEAEHAERITRAVGYRVRAREIATELGWSPERPQAGLVDVR